MNSEQFYTQLINRAEPIRPLIFKDLGFQNIKLPYQVELEEFTDEADVCIDLIYIDFINTTISNCHFFNTKFENLRFWGKSYINNTHFGRCKFFFTNLVAWYNNEYTDCVFNDCFIDFNSYQHNKVNFFSDCYFKNCKIYVSDFTEFENCKFENCRFNKVNKKNNQIKNELNFINCVIDQLEFSQKDLVGLHFFNCIIKNDTVYLRDKYISNCSFVGIKLNIINSQGEFLNLSESSLNIEDSNFIECNFSCSNLNSVINSFLIKGAFYKAKIGDLIECKLNSSQFYKADLTKARFNNCDITNVDFTDIILDSNIDKNSHVDNLFFIQISTNIIGFEKITYCPELKKVFLKFESLDYLKALVDSIKINPLIREYKNDFPIVNEKIRSHNFTLTLGLEELLILVQKFYLNEEVLNDHNVAFKIAIRKQYRLDNYKIADIPDDYFKVIGENLMNVITFLNSINDQFLNHKL